MIRVTLDDATGDAVAVRFYSHEQAAAPFSGVDGTIPDGSISRDFSFSTQPVASDTVVRYTVIRVLGDLSTPFAGQVTVKTPKVISLSTTNGTVTGGSAVTGTVRLDGPAPATGAKVQLANTQPSAIEVPPEVVVPPGQTQFSFLMVTSPVASSTLTVITAKRAGQALGIGRAVRVNPPGPARLDLGPLFGGPQPEPPRARGGLVVKGHILLDGPAPAGGVLLALDSNNSTAVSLPPSVLIPAGGSRAEFELTTIPVPSSTSVTIRAVSTATGVAVERILIIDPTILEALVLSPDAVTGGQDTTATAFLSGIAPPGGLTLTPSTSTPTLVGLPNNVTVLAGGREIEFPVSTRRVTATRLVDIRVSIAGGASASNELKLVPARLGDADGNGTLDRQDHISLVECLSGPAVAATSRCQAIFGFAPATGTVDMRDVSGFLNEFTGELVATPRIQVVVDETLDPVIPELLPLDGAGPGARTLACMTDETGIRSDFVENELMLIADNAAVLDAFVARWEGEVIDSIELFDPARPTARFCLVRINTDLADTSTLVPNLTALNAPAGELAAQLRVSSQPALGLLAAAAAERLGGLLVGPNWIPLPQGISDGSTTEASTGPGSYTPNAFCWDYMMSGSAKNIGVTEAWRTLQAAGRLIPNSVEIAVVDAGFRITPAIAADLPAISVLPDPTTDLTAVVPNPFGCPPLPPSACPWHGVNVLSAAMAVPDNNMGSAGPGGPVARATVFVARRGSSRFKDMFTLVRAVLREAGSGTARIFNLSGGVKVNGAVGVLADIANVIFDIIDIIRDDIVIFAAAGNDGRNVDKKGPLGGEVARTKYLPCELGNVTCVGGIAPGTSLSRDPGSNWGKDDVDLWAPFWLWVGPDFTVPGVQAFSGTSAASPYAAGVAALVFAANPALRARDVRRILKDNGNRDSRDSRVKRVVNALDAVLDERTGLPGAPPSICILSPDDGTPCSLPGAGSVTGGVCPSTPVGPPPSFASVLPTFSKGSSLYLRAEIADRELGAAFCAEPDVVWTSDREGEIARGLTTGATFHRVGLHTITATVEDCTGFTSSDQVVVNIVNDTPSVRLLKPLDGEEFCFGETIEFAASVYDVNEPPSFRLPASSIEWTSNRKGSVFLQGESGNRSLATLGTHTITVTARDPDGATATDSAAITILPLPCDTVVLVQINQPPSDISVCNDLRFQVNGRDPSSGLTFAEIVLEGQAIDAEDGTLSGASLVWRTDQTALQPRLLGTGTSPTVRLFLAAGTGCTLHRVTFTATDSDGNTRTRVRLIRVWQVI